MRIQDKNLTIFAFHHAKLTIMKKTIMLNIKWISFVVALFVLIFLMTFAFISRYYGSFAPRPLPRAIISPLSLPVSPILLIRPTLTVSPNISATVNLTESVAISKLPDITATPIITQSIWLTLTDSAAGYTILYPANFFIPRGIGKSKGELYRTVDISFGNGQGMGINVESNPQKLPIKSFVEEIYAKNKYHSREAPVATIVEGVEIMGMPIYETNVFSGNVQILVPYQDKVYLFSLGYLVGGVISTPEGKAISFKVIDTFRIINRE